MPLPATKPEEHTPHIMLKYDINALHACTLRIMEGIDRTCREHHLTYYIFAGTLIGSLRHKGFIPWDDDMDIAMPRPDYNTLIAHQREWLPENLEMVCYETDKKFPFPFAKIQDANTTIIERVQSFYLGGAYLDVFPLDGMSSCKWKQKVHFVRYWYYKRLIYFKERNPYKHGHGPSCWLPLLIHKCYSLDYIQRNMRKLQLQFDYDRSTLVCDHDDGLKGIFKKEYFGKPKEYEFEGHRFYGPANADAYLTAKYGDYMTPPPADHRRQHNFDILELDKPYREYKGPMGFPDRKE
jgi:lipopolysaccharide cholinephosphotransferase